VLEDHFDGEFPSYVHFGWYPFENINKNSIELCEEISKSQSKLIVEVLDVEAFLGADKASNAFKNCNIDYFILHTPDPINCYSVREMNTVIRKNEWAKNAKIICVPWGVDPTVGISALNKDIDVSFICNINDNWRFHKRRRSIRDVLKSMPVGIRTKIGNWWGGEYCNILSRTKIFVVDASMREFMVQKYLEAPMYGAMLMGDLPCNSGGLLEHGQTMVEIKDISDLQERIQYYLVNEWDRKTIARNARNRVMNNHTVDQTAQEYVRTLIRDWRS